MKKALVITSVASMVDQFLMPSIKLLQEMGYDVRVACNFINGNTCSDEKIAQLKEKLSECGARFVQIDFSRNVMKIKENALAYKQIKKLLSRDAYDIIHCHSPIGGLLTRMAARKARKKGTRVFYTAHGFHFYKGAPLKNWLLYYPVEKICAHFTDVLITINQEDYALAQKKMRAKQVEYVPGVGIELTKFGQAAVDKNAKRKELNIPEEATLLLSVGELNENKNHETVIRAIKDLDVYYIIAGKGDLQEHLQSVINDLELTDRVKLLGFRGDVFELCHAADIFVFPSFREGLSVSVMEAMACGLPVVCSQIRGNIDLIDENGGKLFNPHSVEACKEAIRQGVSADWPSMAAHNLEKIQYFSMENINADIGKIVAQGA